MKSYDFELIFNVPNSEENLKMYSDQLFEAGCDDAIISTGQLGMIALSFTREAENAQMAIESALQNVKEAIPDAKLIEATPDAVSITDIAAILGYSRQYTRKLFHEQTTLPIPIHLGSPTIWHLSEVLHWIKMKRTKVMLEESLFEVSAITRQVNIQKQVEYLNNSDLLVRN
jgi:predicted DNA-binding transcriptional regulator AlpA